MKHILILIFLNIYLFANSLNVKILYLEEIIKKPPALSNIIEEPIDSGLQGVLLAIKDSNRTAQFLNQKFILEKKISKNRNELIKTFEDFIKKENSYIVLNVSDELLTILNTHKLSKNALLINSTNQSSYFRQNYCNKNLLHTIASNAMLYDGLVQFLIKRNWKEWLLIKGTKKEDKKIEVAIKRSAKRFGGKVVDEKTWDFNTDIRRRAQAEMPSFSQSKEHDVVLIADYYKDFGEYVYFNTWLPRPVAGTSGLTPVTWNKVIEAWGAAQLQGRFEKFSNRWMNSKDYSSWLAIRTIVTSIAKTKTKNLQTNIDFIYSNKFGLAAYKGRKLDFRDFNGQLRLPIAIIHPKALVSNSPQVGFLHQKTDLDTLGISKYEMKCK